MTLTTPRLTTTFAALALAGVSVAAAQERGEAFRVPEERRFQGGETWRARTEIETTRTPIGRDAEDEVTTIVWTESDDVLDRPHGFALRSTLTSWRLRSTAPNTETTIEYDDDDLQTITIGRDGREVEFARTWTWEFDPAWRLLDVSGQRRTLKQLYMHATREMAGERDGCDLRSWFMRRARPYVVERWSERLEQAIVRMNNDGLAPVRVVMERLRGGEAIDRDFEARVAAAGDMPAGTVRFVGMGEAGAEFRVTFDVQGTDRPVPEYAFGIDDAGRLAWVDAVGTDVVEEDGREMRVTTRFSFDLEEVRETPQEQERRPQRAPQGVDASDEGQQGEDVEDSGWQSPEQFEQGGQRGRRPY